MNDHTWILAFGLKTRTWTLHKDYGYGCSECCNGDRCDDDCVAKYKRQDKNCPHCQGKGWIEQSDVCIVIGTHNTDNVHGQISGFELLKDADLHLQNKIDHSIDHCPDCGKDWDQCQCHLVDRRLV